MKDKLRELAEEMRISGELGTQSQREITEYFASKLDAILDAEGDGGAVGEVVRNEAGQTYLQWAGKKTIADFIGAKLYTHPARSGVVSDEDVEDVCVQFYKDAWKSFHQHEREQFRKEMRAALEHFAKGERHER